VEDERDRPEPALWWEFGRFVMEILMCTAGMPVSRTEFPDSSDLLAQTVGRGLDVVAKRDGKPLLVEIKAQTPLGSSCLRSTAAQVRPAADHFAKTGRGASAELAVFPGVLSQLKLRPFSERWGGGPGWSLPPAPGPPQRPLVLEGVPGVRHAGVSCDVNGIKGQRDER
jgi:hypothetical protein